MNPVHYFELLRLVAPETLLLITALAILGVDFGVVRDSSLSLRRCLLGLIGIAGCAGAIAWIAAMGSDPGVFSDSLAITPAGQFVKIGILALAIFSLLLWIESSFTDHPGEYAALLLMSAIGMMFMVSSENLLLIFIALELTSLSLYILVGFNKHSAASAEAALKYFLFGGVSAAFTLFGLSLVYGLSGSIYLPEIAAALHTRNADPLVIVALVMTVVGFGFKIAAVPFHLWAPDAYQGAPVSSAAFVASGSKVASFFVLARIMMVGFAGSEGSGSPTAYATEWIPLLAVLAVASMVLGNLAAIVQSSVRRLLAYSAVAHAGYMLLGVMGSEAGTVALLYYAITYGLTTVGAFGVVALVLKRKGNDRISDFAGLGRQEPLVSFCMLVFMLSLAGIPPLAGFFGKFFVFASALKGAAPQMGLLWLVVVALVMSAVSLYYYLLVLKQIYVADPNAQHEVEHRSSILARATLCVLALLVIVLGCVPQWLIGKLSGH